MVRVIYTQGVTGSNPVSPTNLKIHVTGTILKAFVCNDFSESSEQGLFFNPWSTMTGHGQPWQKMTTKDTNRTPKLFLKPFSCSSLQNPVHIP
jgi:hypothetical protein